MSSDARSHRAVNEGDLLRAKLPGFARMVGAATGMIWRAAREHGKLLVSFSGGKDSTVLLDLVKCAGVSFEAVFFDSGAELSSTYEMVRLAGAKTVHPELSLPEMCRRANYWDCAGVASSTETFDLKQVLIAEPAARAMREAGCVLYGVGMRADESAARARMAAIVPPITRTGQGIRICPLIRWTGDEIWAYIASRGLPYNAAYDRMTQAGIPRVAQRIGTLLGGSAVQLGRFAHLKRFDLDTYNRLAAEYPGIIKYS